MRLPLRVAKILDIYIRIIRPLLASELNMADLYTPDKKQALTTEADDDEEEDEEEERERLLPHKKDYLADFFKHTLPGLHSLGMYNHPDSRVSHDSLIILIALANISNRCDEDQGKYVWLYPRFTTPRVEVVQW